MLREPYAGVVFDYSKRFVHPTSEIERSPVEEIGTERVYGRDAVLDRHVVHWHVSIEPHPWSHLLDLGNERRPQHPRMEWVVTRVLMHIDRMPMVRVVHRKDEIEHRFVRSALLAFVLVEVVISNLSKYA